jgi:hypothetical protein
MKGLVIAALAFGVASLVSGCGSGGGGPASPAFDPFGSEPTGASSEPTGTSPEGSPGGTAVIAELCATDCARIMAACPSAAGTNCVASCEASFLSYPACAASVQAYLSCISSIAIICSPYGSLDVSACQASQIAAQNCLNAAGGGAQAG